MFTKDNFIEANKAWHRRFMTISTAGFLEIYRLLVNLPPSVHLQWFISWDECVGLIFLQSETHTIHSMRQNFLSSFSVFSLQLGSVPPGFWNITLPPFITIFPPLCLPRFFALSKLLCGCLLSILLLHSSSSVLNPADVERKKRHFLGGHCVHRKSKLCLSS